jgi:signal peptidase I
MDQNSPSLIDKANTKPPKRTELFVIAMVGLVVGGYLGARYFMVEVRHVMAGSMEPSLRVGDRLIINKISSRFSKPQRGEIIVFSPTDQLKKEGYHEAFVKRVIGLPGENVEVRDDKVFIDGQPLAENYSSTEQATQMTEIYIEKNKKDPNVRLWDSKDKGPAYKGVVPDGEYFVLGDHRSDSLDSRIWGFVPQDKIVGTVAFRLNIP